MHHSPVAIFATIASDSTTSSSFQTIVFYNIVTNVGGGYNPRTGVFLTPTNGLYMFSTSVMVKLSTPTTNTRFKIRKNGSHVASLMASDIEGNWETVSGTVILPLLVGDTVKVTCVESRRFISGGHFTFFSGTKLSSVHK
ncbi:complement C1q-like protein 4 [Mya arenaria]|uniref:complement C1q-like protein 4 n=1 Tax=Mya arenaria TaxID=6604 RepID=UPI0022E0D908|nr:complement C1q-like protein 4 [Mya arenaria]